MRPIRLIRRVDKPSGRGPGNGQYALQKALRARDVPWLSIGGRLEEGEIAWVWCWLDGNEAAAMARTERPLVIGPNVLFRNSRRPCELRSEQVLCNATSCRLLFTESPWYRRLIEDFRGPDNRAPVVVWPYPIDPQPCGPRRPTHDLLVYVKGGCSDRLIARLQESYPHSVLLNYGHYHRNELFGAAERCRACAYLSEDDRGPLALAEILLAGCPTVGIPTGAPFVQQGQTGILLEQLEAGQLIEAIEDCLEMDRCRVAALAAEQFDTERIVDTVLDALREVATSEDSGRDRPPPDIPPTALS